jgi:hypothetical protein
VKNSYNNGSGRRMDAGQRSEVLAVAELMMAASIDQIVGYDEMSRVGGCDVRERRWIVIQAKNLLNREHGIVFANVPGVGYRRLASESGVKHAGERAMRRTRNAAKNGRQTLANALERVNDIAPSEQRHAYQRLVTLGMIKHLAQDRVVRAMPEDPPKKTPVDLDALKKAFGF